MTGFKKRINKPRRAAFRAVFTVWCDEIQFERVRKSRCVVKIIIKYNTFNNPLIIDTSCLVSLGDRPNWLARYFLGYVDFDK